MLGDQALELADEFRMKPQFEFCLDPPLERDEAQPSRRRLSSASVAMSSTSANAWPRQSARPSRNRRAAS